MDDGTKLQIKSWTITGWPAQLIFIAIIMGIFGLGYLAGISR